MVSRRLVLVNVTNATLDSESSVSITRARSTSVRVFPEPGTSDHYQRATSVLDHFSLMFIGKARHRDEKDLRGVADLSLGDSLTPE